MFERIVLVGLLIVAAIAFWTAYSIRLVSPPIFISALVVGIGAVIAIVVFARRLK